MVKFGRRFLTKRQLPLLCFWAGIMPFADAHAGISDWMNETFTFRRDQKPLVQPRGANVPPRVVLQPHYPPHEHETWSQFYTRTDLVPTDYMAGSASKVMRPASQMGSGWGMMSDRMNMPITADNIAIGEPGDSPGVRASDGNIGRETKIGAPVNDWRERGGVPLESRPGDFDYKMAEMRERLDESGGREIKLDVQNAQKSENVVEFRDGDDEGEKPQTYVVKRGDTLEAIAGRSEIYGERALWPLIYSANRKKVGGKPENLKPGVELTIPRDYSKAQAQEARQRAKRKKD